MDSAPNLTTAPSKAPRTNMPLILTAILPGLGHFFCGARAKGMIYISMTVTMLVLALSWTVQCAFAIVNEEEWTQPAAGLVGVLVYGAIYSVALMLDVSRFPSIPEPEGKFDIVGAVILFELIISAALCWGIVKLIGA